MSKSDELAAAERAGELYWTIVDHIDPDTEKRVLGPPGPRGGLSFESPRPAGWTVEDERALLAEQGVEVPASALPAAGERD